MAERLTSRNKMIAELFSDGEKLKAFYRFAVRNPHITLRDACQILILRPDATVCYGYDEWNEVGRWVKRGAKGISYYDYDGLRQFVYDASDTKGENRALFPIIPVEHLLSGLDELNDASFADGQESDYDKIKKGVHFYLHEQGLFTGDEERDKFMCEGVAFSLYARTGLSQGEEVTLTSLPFAYSENAAFVKEVYVQTAGLAQEIEDAYRNKKSEVSVIDDTEEETPTDEPISIKELQTPPVEPEEPQSFTVNSYYRTYLNVQKQYPQAIVFQRLGDFYEVMGENAKVAAEELDLTLTGRNVGLPDRIPMCGVPYHAVDKYIQKLLKNHSVIIVEPESEPIRILSETETRGENAGEKSKQTPHEFPDDEPEALKQPEQSFSFKDVVIRDMDMDHSLFSEKDERDIINFFKNNFAKAFPDSQNEIEDTNKRSQAFAKLTQAEQCMLIMSRDIFTYSAPKILPEIEKLLIALTHKYDLLIKRYEQGEKDTGNPVIFPDDEPNPFDDEQSDEDDWRSELADELSDMDEREETNEEIEDKDSSAGVPNETSGTAKEKEKIRSKKPEQGIKDRKRKEKPPRSLFDVAAPQAQSHLEQVIEYELKRGSHVVDGKFRIFDKYNENPSEKAFAEFLKKEYGIGGSYVDNTNESHDAKGIRLRWKEKEHPENNFDILLKWNEVAVRIADLIDDDKYLTEQEKEKYLEYRIEQQRLREQRAEEARQKRELIDKVIVSAPDERKQRILDEYADTTKITEFAEFLKAEYGTSDEHGEGYAAVYNVQGIWISKGENVHDDPNRIYLNWNEFADKVCTLIENDKYIEPPDTQEVDVADAVKDVWHEFDDEDDNAENTDLNAVLDQSELGGAKTRFKNNVAAIKLVNKLYEENRNPTSAERKVLAQFVGWGGLSQAFDESNAQWQKEYAELKGLLSQEDYEQARSSTLNAYYTAKDVIEGIYSALNRMGVKGNNRILEPAMGTGNFFGYMPQEIAEGARLYGVELDNLTGRIATKLYPQADVQIKGFEDTNFPNNKFDIIVGNVPFGGYGIADSDYNRYNFMVHDYFLCKSIDKVKPGGIVAIITSKGTMDKLNQSARKYVAARAELLGAIRLPNTAFKQTAGTEAVADILFFQKLDYMRATSAEETPWLEMGKTEEGYEINRYFIEHPEMVLGTLAEEKGLYGGIDVTVKPDGRNLKDALSEVIQNLPQELYINPETPPEIELSKPEEFNVKPFCYKAVDGKLFMRVGDEMEEQRIPSYPQDAYERIEQMIALREELHSILKIQTEGCSDEVLRLNQSKLNRLYDSFVRRYGNLNSKTNTRLFKDDGDSALLFACEDIDKDTGEVKKSDVFSKRTIRPYTVPTNTDDSFEALQISKNERGRVDIAYIEELTGKDYDTVIAELGNAIFRDPELIEDEDRCSGFVTAEEYLSGKVVAKLAAAQRYTADHPEYQKNVDALLAVQPEPITASEISVRLGQTWVGKEYYKKFYLELIGTYWYLKNDVELYYNPHDSSWRLDQKESVRRDTKMKQTEVYGTKRAPAYRLFMDCMNGRDTNIFDTIEENGKEVRVLNQAETIAAREKQNKIREEFQNWVFADPERREDLERKYNAVFNQTRLPSYDGSYLRFPEMNPAIELNPHQKNAVHRIITSDGSTLLHHVVGSGKTFTMIASIMKMRQLGLCQKAMVAVPNHLVEQWAGEWRKLYPNAKILVATKEDLERDNRQKFVSKVALGDWDGIIIAQSAFAKIGISKERQVRKLGEEITSVRMTLESRKKERMSGGSVKNLERIIKSKQSQLKKLMDDKSKDNVLIFENLGVDYLYIDEAHYYKNLFLFTKMNNVAGISTAASQRASDLKLKCEYLQELHDSDKGIVFATGTPISNSMTEMYTMQTYLQPEELIEKNIMFFDGWAADFGETVTSLELSPSGQGYRTRTRFSKFTNLPELQKMYRSFADVITSDMVKLDVPEAEKNVITLKPSETVIELAEKIAARADRIYGGGVDPHEDNMLKVTSDGKKLALDPRCFVSESADEQGSKLNEAAQRIYEIWEETTEDRGTQIVFCDLSTPKGKFTEYVQGINFDAYNELKYKLVQSGIPAEEIAFIHDANTDEQKQALFDKVNSGAVRVLIGSTEKCGAGTNVQKRLVALHHLDTPYRPSDMEQREGRIIRQGNTNKKVQIYTYVMERTFDSYSYQILENKQRFISQICKGDFTAREYEDVDTTTLSYAEIKAITAANPQIKRKMEVDTEIIRLRVLEGQYKKNLYALQDKIRKDFPEEIRKQELLIERVGHDLQTANSNRPAPDTFLINVNGIAYADKKEGGRALMDALYASKPDVPVAEYCGFKISLLPITIIGGEREIALSGEGQYTLTIGDSASGNLTRIENFIEDLPARKERLEKRLMQMKSDLEIAEEQVKKPFEHAGTLSELLKEQAELNAELNLDKREQVIMDDGNGGEEENYKGLPVQERSIREVDILEEEVKNTTGNNYEREVKKSVAKEYDEFRANMLRLSPEKVFEENYKIRAYNEFSSVIEDMEEYFSEDDYKALYRERGHILEHLYDEFLDSEGVALDSYDDTVAFMKDYCRHYHKDIYCNKPVYLQTAAYANAHDEMELYRASHGLSQGCKRDIDEAIRSNYDGMSLKGGFEDELIKQYGLERVSYIVATTINAHDYDGRYSRENKEWAKTVPMSESEDERSGCCLNIHPAILDGFASMIRKKIKENQQEGQETMAQERQEEEEKYLNVTPQGHKVVSIIKDKDNRNIAILHRESHGDFVVAARYDPKDGKWAQGRYDFPTLEAAEEYRKEKYVNAASSAVIDEIKPEKSSIFIHVAREAQVAKHEFSTFFRMPTESEYAGYGYSIYNNRIKNGKQLVDLQSDTRELCYDIRLNEDETVKLTRSNGDEVELTARELMDEVSGTTAKDYEPKPRVTVMIPREAKGNVYDNSTMFSLPNSVSSERYTYFLPSRFVQEGEGENADKLILSIPEDFTVKAQNFDGDDMEYSAQKFIELCKDTTADDYYFDDDEENDDEEKATWFYVTVNDAAKITAYENSTLFKMPKGEYEGFTYYIPNGFLKEDTEKGTIRIGLPEDFVVRPKNMKTGEEINLSAEAFADHVRNKKLSAYRYLHRPSDEAKAQFSLIEQALRKNVPEEMKARDNWVAITTFEKEDGKIGKRPIDCNTGKYAEADDSKTWTSFEKACKFARENGCVTIAYALDGEDKIACIDLDHCLQDNGDFTELASKTFQLGNGTYCERSLSGKGLHIFGKTEGSDLRSFSQDGDLEYYRSFRFIAMTGDNYGSSELKSFDNAPMKALLESKLQKREEWKGAGMGVEGLSLMGDREVYEKACSAYNGERFKALFEGQDLQNNHSNSDMSLMHYLAFWCNGDKDQMLRMFSSSGLFRRNKSPEYYEYTANKAIETTPERYTPKVQSAPKKPTNGNNSGGNGKR